MGTEWSWGRGGGAGMGVGLGCCWTCVTLADEGGYYVFVVYFTREMLIKSSDI